MPRMADLLAQLRAVEAEFGPDCTVSEMRGTLPLDPYLTRQTVVGHGNPALLIRLTPDGGMKLEAVAKGDMDVQRKELAAMYAKRKRRWRDTGTDDGRSTDQLQDNPNEALDTATGIDDND